MQKIISNDGSQTWLSFFLCILLFSIGIFGILYDSQFIRFGVISAVVIIGSLLVFSIRRKVPAGIVLTAIGVLTIFMSSLISTDLHLTEDNIKPHLFWWDPQPQKEAALAEFPSWGKAWSFVTGTTCIVLGMILSFKPNLIFVKNYLPFDYPYPVWRSFEQALMKPNSNLIPLRSLLSTKERIILSKYRFILVSIENKRYLVEKNEKVPEDCIIIRTKSGNSICGL